MDNNIHLTPTKRQGIYYIELHLPHQTRYIGYLNTKIGERFKKVKKTNLFEKQNGLADALELYTNNIKFPFKTVKFVLDGKTYETTREYFLKFGQIFQFTGFEKQIFLPLEKWGLPQAIKYERSIGVQESLF